MSLYSADIVSFDLDPPLRYTGADKRRRALAFVHSVNHVSGTLADGHASDLWVRWTACFRRIDGVWRIVHDHVSVPADLKHGQAVLNLTP